MNYYNEWDKGAAAWLRELINSKLIPNGYVDERSITEVTASDLEGFTQCHFFAGIGGWSYALQLAGIPATTRLWTGSPPCQPFSVAGKQLGQLDERHLAPAFMRLVDQCRPPVLFGEQVAAAIGKHWLDDLFLELERQGYACGAAVLPAASVGAPHKRDRLFFGAGLAQSVCTERDSERLHGLGEGNQAQGGGAAAELAGRGYPHRLAYSDDTRPQRRQRVPECADKQSAGSAGLAGGVAYSGYHTASGETEPADNDRAQADRPADKFGGRGASSCSAYPHHGFWSDTDWLGCRDGKFRPVEAWAQPLVDGFPGRMGCSSDPSFRKAIEEIGFPLGKDIPARVARLRGYGNAIVPQAAAEFIKAFLI